MRLTRIRIENFRSIKSLDLDLGETTVFIGQNNSGKTAILDAIRIALTRRWGQRGTGFTEYDVHLATDEDDPRLVDIATTLTGATKVAARDRDGSVDLRLMPLKSWDILSKAEIILRNEPTWPWLPLQRHGQGVQSLSVIFLFQAFVDHLLKELYEPESTAVLALEEPETHLHPQAARTLWGHVNQLPGQKIITTHSPYFVQHVPFRDLRLVHLTDEGTSVCSLPSSFSAVVPHVAALDPIIANSGGLLTFDRATNTLTVNGELDENRYRDLQASYGTHPERAVVSGVLRQLRDTSRLFIGDDELRALETFARRIRGEIFFAKRWFIVEGQAEYLLVHALARALGYDLDEHGVAVIDAVNNGNPATFAVLARALSIPWLAVFDGDPAGVGYCDSIGNRHFSPAVEEERRNCFVAITRTKECLVLSRAAQYRGWRKAPSRFLVEMGLVSPT
jgi:putative ATP-dependent endonuclease of the OLD family